MTPNEAIVSALTRIGELERLVNALMKNLEQYHITHGEFIGRFERIETQIKELTTIPVYDARTGKLIERIPNDF